MGLLWFVCVFFFEGMLAHPKGGGINKIPPCKIRKKHTNMSYIVRKYSVTVISECAWKGIA